AGAMALVDGILGLDPANVADQFSLAANLTQTIIDPADGMNSAGLLLDPAAGTPRNVIQVEDFGDQVVPNPANEALAVAAGLPILDPFVQNLHQNPVVLPIANFTTPENFNPIQNVEVPTGASTAHFFARTVDLGGALAAPEPTPDVVVDFVTNAVASRVTAGRSILGTSPLASDADVPPGPAITV